jgi:GNAT superfamily N-acetyltransferase
MSEQLQTLREGELSPEDLEECISILDEGKAVNVAFARRELPVAPVVVLKRVDGKIVGLGAIKRQRPDYAAGRALASGYDFDQNMHEIGYVAVRKAFGRKGFSAQIMNALLSAFPPQPFWATTFNEWMERTLERAGFTKRGDPWQGDSGNTLRLWIRTPPSK